MCMAAYVDAVIQMQNVFSREENNQFLVPEDIKFPYILQALLNKRLIDCCETDDLEKL